MRKGRMSSSVPVLQNVPWVDYGAGADARNGLRVLCSEVGAFCIASLLAVWITLLAPQYWKLLARIWHRSRIILGYDASHRKDHPNQLKPRAAVSKQAMLPNGVQDQQTPTSKEGKGIEPAISEVRAAGDVTEQAPKNLMETISTSRTPEQAISRLFSNFSKFNRLAACIAILLCTIAFSVNTMAAIAPAFLTLDNTALSTSQNCGMWVPDLNSSVANPMGQIMNRVESYYSGCYEAESPQQKCDVFPEKNLHINFTDGVECPFDGAICLGDNSTVILDTGYLPVKHLGINSPHDLLFRRRAECSVLDTQSHFDSNVNHTTDITTVRFYLGNRAAGKDNTYEQNRSVAIEEYFSPTGYLVKTVSENLGQFQPISALASDKGYIFLAFINTFHVNYPTPSYDPIFNAKTEGLCPASNQTCYSNTQIPASVLGCIETAEVCMPDMENCYDVWGPNALKDLPEHDRDGAAERQLVTFALKYSDFGSILATKHGLLLNATQQIVGTRLSQSLDPQQWKLEVRRLFDMAILRTKFEILAVARGDRASFQNYLDVMPHVYRGVCRRVKFQAKGFVNLSLVGIICAILLPALPLLVVFKIRGLPPIAWLFVGAYRLLRLLKRRR